MRTTGISLVTFLALILIVSTSQGEETEGKRAGKASPLGKDWRCYRFPGDVELHRQQGKDGSLVSERRVEAGKTVYENVLHSNGTLHVQDLYRDGVLERRIWYPSPSEVSGGTYKPGQIKGIDFYRNKAVVLERRFCRDGSYMDREFRDGQYYSDTAYSAGRTMLHRHMVQKERFEYFYDDGRLKKVCLTGGAKPVTTYYDRRGEVTTVEAVLRYEATLRSAEDNDAKASCGLAITVTPTRQNYVLGEEVELLIQVTCLAKDEVILLPKGEDGSQAELILLFSQRTGFGLCNSRAFVPEEKKGQRRISLKPGQVLRQRVKLKPWGPVFGVIPSKAYPGLIGMRATLHCRLADKKTVASPKSARMYLVVEERH